MARTGRKRRLGQRERDGLSLLRRGPDRGTPENQTKREWLSQSGDPARATYPLGVMLVNDIIGQSLHDTGCRYAWLHRVVHGRVSIAASRFDVPSRGASPPRCDTAERAAWVACPAG